MKHTMVLGGSQFTRCIPLSKMEAKIKNQAGFFVFDKFTLQVNLGDKSGGGLTSLLNILFFITSEVNSTMRRCFFVIQTSDRICSFLPYLNPLILHFFTILPDKLHSFNIQDDRSTRFLCTTNYSIDHTKRFHEDNSIMPGFFS